MSAAGARQAECGAQGSNNEKATEADDVIFTAAHRDCSVRASGAWHQLSGMLPVQPVSLKLLRSQKVSVMQCQNTQA